MKMIKIIHIIFLCVCVVLISSAQNVRRESRQLERKNIGDVENILRFHCEKDWVELKELVLCDIFKCFDVLKVVISRLHCDGYFNKDFLFNRQISEIRTNLSPEQNEQATYVSLQFKIVKLPYLYLGEAQLSSMFPNLKELVLYDNDFENVSVNIFQNMTKLQGIFLHQNLLEDLHEDLFKDNVNLEEINLSSNRILNCPANLFKNLEKLKQVRMSRNQIEEIPEDLFSNNLNLEIIEFRNNKIKFLSSNLFQNLTKLTDLDLQGNLIEELPKDLFKNNVNLRRLNLSGNRLTKIYVNFKMFPKLEFLDLRNNFCINRKFNSILEIQTNMNKRC